MCQNTDSQLCLIYIYYRFSRRCIINWTKTRRIQSVLLFRTAKHLLVISLNVHKGLWTVLCPVHLFFFFFFFFFFKLILYFMLSNNNNNNKNQRERGKIGRLILLCTSFCVNHKKRVKTLAKRKTMQTESQNVGR